MGLPSEPVLPLTLPMWMLEGDARPLGVRAELWEIVGGAKVAANCCAARAVVYGRGAGQQGGGVKTGM